MKSVFLSAPEFTPKSNITMDVSTNHLRGIAEGASSVYCCNIYTALSYPE